MPKTKRCSKGDGTHHGWVIRCPGCDDFHVVDTRWTFNGDFERPTFSPSLLLNGDPTYHNPAAPRCHSFIREGRIEFLGDCSHALAGKTVDLPELTYDP